MAGRKGFSIDGVSIGHASDPEGLTGCTVMLLPERTIGGYEVRGGAPGSRETDLLHPGNLVETVDAFVLAGGSAFGLAAAAGVMRFLSEQGRGYGMDPALPRVPIVPAAVIFDLGIGDATARPDAAMGYQACLDAVPDFAAGGSVGAGTGATVCLALGRGSCVRGGLGVAVFEGGCGLKLAATVAVNAFGDIIDEGGQVMAGPRAPDGSFLDTRVFLENVLRGGGPGGPGGEPPGGSSGGMGEAGSATNTTIGIIITNARLDKNQTMRLARAGHQGLARAIAPSHTRFDGDLFFSAATGAVEANSDLLEVEAAELVARAIRTAVREAASAGGVPALRDL